MLAILLALGTWQIYRLHWKEGILQQVAQAEAAPAVPLGPHPTSFQKVSVTGRLRPDLAASFGAEVRDTPAGTLLGTQLIVPLERAGADPVLVDLGWVPNGPRPTLPSGTVTIAGYVRQAETPGLFTPNPDPARREFYALQPEVIGRALGLAKVAPFTLIAMGPDDPAHYPVPAQELPRPPNNHLQYALTWYGLAGVLVVMFVARARKG